MSIFDMLRNKMNNSAKKKRESKLTTEIITLPKNYSADWRDNMDLNKVPIGITPEDKMIFWNLDRPLMYVGSNGFGVSGNVGHILKYCQPYFTIHVFDTGTDFNTVARRLQHKLDDDKRSSIKIYANRDNILDALQNLCTTKQEQPQLIIFNGIDEFIAETSPSVLEQIRLMFKHGLRNKLYIVANLLHPNKHNAEKELIGNSMVVAIKQDSEEQNLKLFKDPLEEDLQNTEHRWWHTMKDDEVVQFMVFYETLLA